MRTQTIVKGELPDTGRVLPLKKGTSTAEKKTVAIGRNIEFNIFSCIFSQSGK
jgi:hypothetical protein